MMNYVAFLGVSHLDNLYVEATHKMKSAKLILGARGEELKMRNEAISWQKVVEADGGKVQHDNDGHGHGGEDVPDPLENNTLWWCEYNMWIFMRVVIIWQALCKFIYKSLYFYLFPYCIVPVSYWLYDVYKDPKAMKPTGSG